METLKEALQTAALVLLTIVPVAAIGVYAMGILLGAFQIR